MGKGEGEAGSMAMPGAPWMASRGHPDRECEDAFWIDRARGIALIADGMGGREGAGDAARRSSQHIREIVNLLPAEGERAGWSKKLMEYLRNDLLEYRAEHKLPEADAGAVLMIKDGDEVEVSWCGDVRAYLWEGNKLTRLTLDHSKVLEDLPKERQEEILGHIDRAMMPEELPEGLLHYWRNHNHTSSGVAEGEIGMVRTPFRAGQKILLCSDGVHDNLAHYEISEAFQEQEDPSELILERAWVRSGKIHPRAKKDDITLLIIPHA